MRSLPESPEGSRSPDVELQQKLYERIQEQLGAQEYETWFRGTPCNFQPPCTFLFTTRNRFRKAWMKNKFCELIRTAAKSVISIDPVILFEVTPLGNEPQTSPGASPASSAHPEEAPPPPSHDLFTLPQLNQDLTLDNFVVGPASRVAHAAALAVTEYPGKTYNPLYIYGEAGVGKTHLLQGIAHQLAATSNLRRLYTNAESFLSHYTSAVERRDLESFRSYYRGTEVLILDDVHFLATKTKTREEFLHTLNFFLSENRQIVISSAFSPTEIEEFPERLASRFRWGLVARMELPSFETRVTIVLRKALLKNHDLPLETAEYLSLHVDGSLRELEGALTRLISLSSMHRSPLTVEMAQLALHEIFTEERRVTRAITVESILEAVQKHYRLKPKELLGRSKVRTIVLARQLGMYLTRKLTPLSLEQIGLRFGGRDHTTVLYAQQRIERILNENPQVQTDLQLIQSRLEASRSLPEASDRSTE